MLFRLLRRYSRPYLGLVAVVVALQLVQTGAALSVPTLNADAIDNGVLKGDVGQVRDAGLWMVSATLLQGMCAAAAVHVSARAAMALGRDLRAAVFARVQRFSGREFSRFGAASLITRSTHDVQQIQQLVMTVLTLLVVAPLTAAGSVVMAWRQDPPLAALLIVVLPVLSLSLALISSRMAPLSASLQRRIDRMNALVREQITGIRVIRAFGRDDHEQRRFAAANGDTLAVALRLGRTQALMMPTFTLIVEGAGIAVLWFGGHRVAGGALQPGTVMALLHYLTQILQAVLMALVAFMLLPRAAACAARIQEVLTTPDSLPAPARPVSAVPAHGQVVIEAADFRYPGAQKPVLHGVSLTAEPGETVAVVGSSGSGKSTLLHLVPRLYDPDRGTVAVGGRDVRDLDRRTLAATVGLVVQKPYLFSGTVAGNLRHGNPQATDEDLWHALSVAQADDFVRAAGKGLGAPVAQGGGNLSGGQRQRLAIAQVLVRRPRVYLFDDSFSALDAVTDARLQEALRRETAGATRVVVAQRVATLRDADRIVVLDEGRVTGCGTHPQLMADNATYREIVLSQPSAPEAVR